MSSESWDWGNNSSFQLLPMAADTSTSSKQKNSEVSETSCLCPTYPIPLSNYHAGLGKITECEPWNFLPCTKTEDRTQTIEYAHSPTSNSSHRQPSSSSSPSLQHSIFYPSSDKLANSDSSGCLINRQLSSSSESQDQPKKRRNSLGKHERSPSTKNNFPNPELEETGKKVNVKLSSKTSHSVVERRYRENLSNRIAELNQTLSETRHNSSKDGANLDAAHRKSTAFQGKARKAEVLLEAMRYVKQAELESLARIKEIEFLRSQVTALEKLVQCGDCTLLKQFASHGI